MNFLKLLVSKCDIRNIIVLMVPPIRYIAVSEDGGLGGRRSGSDVRVWRISFRIVDSSLYLPVHFFHDQTAQHADRSCHVEDHAG